MVWKLSDSHNLGRWVQPTLSMVFWYGWADPKEYAKLRLPKTSGRMALLDGHTIFWKKDYETLLAESQAAIDAQDTAFFDRLFRVSEKTAQAHWQLGEAFRKGTAGADRLSEFFDSWHSLCVPWTMVILAAIPVEKALERQILEERLDPQSVASAVAPVEKTPLMRQNLEAQNFSQRLGQLKIPIDGSAEEILENVRKKDPTFAEKIRKHVEQFAWVGTHHLWGNGFGYAGLFDQIRNNSTPASSRPLSPFSKKTAWLILQSQCLAYWRQFMAESSDHAAFWARPALQTAAEKLDMTYDDLIWLLDSEILSGLDGQKIPKLTEIRLRKKAFGIVEDPDGVRVIVGRELDSWISALVPVIDTAVSEIRGTVASPGTAEGFACVCITPHDAEKLKKGQILVVPQTTPDFVPFMRKASAIVTEEGGLTCHAAIVSRELGKPCVVGTKVATRVIQNGEMIRVDANFGTVFRLDAAKASH